MATNKEKIVTALEGWPNNPATCTEISQAINADRWIIATDLVQLTRAGVVGRKRHPHMKGGHANPYRYWLIAPNTKPL